MNYKFQNILLWLLKWKQQSHPSASATTIWLGAFCFVLFLNATSVLQKPVPRVEDNNLAGMLLALENRTAFATGGGGRVCLVLGSFHVETRPLLYHLGLSPAPQLPLPRSPGDLSNPWSLGTETGDREPATVHLLGANPPSGHTHFGLWKLWLSRSRDVGNAQWFSTAVSSPASATTADTYLSHIHQLFLSVKKGAIWIPDAFFLLSHQKQFRTETDGKTGVSFTAPSQSKKMSFSSLRGRIRYPKVYFASTQPMRK